MICLSHLQFQCLWIPLPAGHPWQLPSRIHLNYHYCQNVSIWQTLEKNDTHFLEQYYLTTTKCYYKEMVKSVAVIINKEWITFSIVLKLQAASWVLNRLGSKCHLMYPRPQRCVRGRGLAKLSKRGPQARSSTFYPEGHDAGVLGDASHMCSAHYGLNSTPPWSFGREIFHTWCVYGME